MPTWGGILKELKQISQEGINPPFDHVRRKYLAALYRKTQRNVILYAAKWTQSGVSNPEDVSIAIEDIQGLMEVIHGLKGTNLDLIIHSPGGSPEATEAVVSYLRTKFHDIRVFIPQAAMSAATMLACSANRIVMGKHSSIGPIDTQLIVDTQLGPQMVPAQAIIDQFEMAKQECINPQNLGSWLPILGQYGPALLVQCDEAIKLSKELVATWLASYMFEGANNAVETASNIAEKLADHTTFKSHGRFINRKTAKKFGLIIEDLEFDSELQDIVLSVFHTTTHTFDGTPAVKIIENHHGKAFIKQNIQVVVPQQPPPVSKSKSPNE